MGEIVLKLPPYTRRVPSGYYWEPSRKVRALGFAPEPLGADAVAAIARARELNRRVAAEIKATTVITPRQPAEGTVAWWSAQYQRPENEDWARLAEKTKAGYRQALKRIEAWTGDKHIASVSRKAVKIWYRQMAEKTPAFAAATIRVLRILVNFAADEGEKVANLYKMRLHVAGGGREPWEDFEISAYLDEAKCQGRQSMALALMLGVCLGQREGDVLRLPRRAYDAGTGMMAVRQQKTGKSLSVPVLPELTREIALTPAAGTIFVVSEKSGAPYKPRHFASVHRKICRAAGISDQRWFMDLRHTAATRLGEAGCADDLIRAVTGHQSRGVVARYVKPNDAMAKAAITKLQDHRGKKQ